MANWWENDPVASQLPAKPSRANFWETDQAISAGTGHEEPLNMDREAGAFDRAGSSIKMTPAGVHNWLAEQHGQQNVATDKAGMTYLRDPDKKEWYPLDSNSINAKDFTADWLGPAIEATPTMATGGILSALGLGAAGNIGRQGLSASIGGSDEMSATDRATSTGIAAATAGLGEGVFGLGQAILGRVSPKNIIARYGQRAVDSPDAAVGQQLERAGMPLSFGESTMDPNMLMVEGMLRRRPGAMDIVREHDQKQLQWVTQKLNGLMDKIHANPTSADTTGMAVESTFRRAVDQARTIRRTQARSDFAALDEATGSQPIIKPDAALAALDEMIARFSTPGGGDKTAAIATQLQGVRRSFVEDVPVTAPGPDGKPVTTIMRKVKPRSAVDMERLLEVYSKAADGGDTMFQNIDQAQGRMIGSKLLRALNDDLEAAAADPAIDGTVAAQLQAARQNYAKNSKPIDDLRQSVLGSYVGNRKGDIQPSEIFAKLKNMDAPSLKRSLALISTADPQIGQEVKRTFIEEAIRTAYSPTDQSLARLGLDAQQPFSAKRFSQAILKSPAWELLDAAEKSEGAAVMTGIGRMAEKMGEGSPTAPLMWAASLVTNAAKAIGGSPRAALELASTVFIPRRAARLMTTPEGRRAILTLSSPDPTLKDATQALAVIQGLGVRDTSQAPDVRRDPALDRAIGQYQTQGLPSALPSGQGQ